MPGVPERVRPHHWGFANAWLKSSFQRIPETIVAAIARARSPEPVTDSWANFSKTLEPEDRMPPEGLAVSAYTAPTEGDTWFFAIVEFPPARHPGEAQYAALAVAPSGGELRPDLEDEAPREGTRQRYFLLERTDGGKPELVEWADDERHPVHLGDGASLEADEEAFVRAVTDVLEADADAD